MKLLNKIVATILCLLYDKRASFNQTGLKRFAIFAVLIWIGMWIGGMISAWITPYFGFTGTTIGSIIGFAVAILPAYWLIRRFRKKAV